MREGNNHNTFPTKSKKPAHCLQHPAQQAVAKFLKISLLHTVQILRHTTGQLLSSSVSFMTYPMPRSLPTLTSPSQTQRERKRQMERIPRFPNVKRTLSNLRAQTSKRIFLGQTKRSTILLPTDVRQMNPENPPTDFPHLLGNRPLPLRCLPI